MNVRQFVATLVIGLIAATPAWASIELRFDQVDPGNGATAGLSFNGSAVNARIGQMLFDAQNQGTDSPVLSLLSGDSLLTFCIELGQYVSGSWQTYEKMALSGAPNPGISGATSYTIGAARASALDLLADNYWSAATGGNLVNAVAFQLSVWELVHESPAGDTSNPPLASPLDVSNNAGTFFVNNSNPTGDLLNAITTANQWLSEIAEFYDGDSDAGPLTSNDSLSLIALTNPEKQDQLVQYVGSDPFSNFEPNPEPLSAMIWAGLLSLGACSRSRK